MIMKYLRLPLLVIAVRLRLKRLAGWLIHDKNAKPTEADLQWAVENIVNAPPDPVEMAAKVVFRKDITSEERTRQLIRHVPFITSGRGRKCLYIGANKHRADCLRELLAFGWHTTLVEAFSENAEFWRESLYFDEVYHGDIGSVIQTVQLGKFDLIIWWHGPEHETKYRLFNVGLIDRLEKMTKEYIVFGFPYGKAPQGVVDGNIREIHASTLYPEDFEAIEYTTSTIGEADKPGSHVLAYKRLW